MDTVLDVVKDFADVSLRFPSFSASLNPPRQVNPIAKATVSALKVACSVCLLGNSFHHLTKLPTNGQVLRNHNVFNHDIDELGDCIRDLLSYIVEDQSRKDKIGQLNLTIISILRAISQAVEFITSYADQKTPGRYTLLFEL
jgi:hypothetical protein